MILWVACGDPADSDTDVPVADTAAPDVTITASADQPPIPQALVVADVDGDGADDVVAGGGLCDQTCVFSGPFAADRAWSDGRCWESELAADLGGYAVDVSGSDLAIGAPLADAGGYQRGKAYVVPPPTESKQNLADAPFVVSGAADLDGFGIAVLWLDADVDGEADLLVGAPGNDDGGPGAGEVYIFTGPLEAGAFSAADASGSVLGFGARRHASAEPGQGVGYSLSDVGDLDADGVADLVLPGGGHDEPATDAGVAAIFFAPVALGRFGLFSSDVQITGPVENAWLGEPSVGSDDLDGDGRRELLLGSNGQAIGHIYRYEAPFTDASGAWAGAEAFDGTGTAFTTADVDGDGQADALIGSPYAGDHAGGVAVYLGPVPDGDLGADDADARWIGETDSYFGRVLATGELDGRPGVDVAVGAPALQAGSIRLFFGD